MGWLKNLVGFENSFSKNFGSDILKNPTRLITGIDPASTKLWNTALNRDDEALVNMFGSPGKKYYGQAEEEGIDTGAASKFHTVADTVAGIAGAGGLSGSLGFGNLGAASGSGGVGGAFGSASNIAKIGNAAAGDGTKGETSMDLSSLGGNSGWGGLISAGLGAAGSYMANKNNQKAAEAGATQTNQIDPRIGSILFGADGTPNSGLLGQFQSFMNQPQDPNSKGFGDFASAQLQSGGPARNAIDRLYNTGMSLSDGTYAPVRVNAPSQNSLNLAPAYNRFINENPAENPYLTRALQSGIDQTNAAFSRNQTDVTNALQRQILPGIRGTALAAGQYGGSRQGIAEGNALSDYTKQLGNANLQLGLANSANTLGAQSTTFNQGQDRSLNALNTLSGQQYGVANQNAQLEQRGNEQNAANKLAGAGLLSGAVGQTTGLANANDNYAINRAGQVAGLLSPFIGVNSSTTSTQPSYSNTAGNVLGGAATGLALWNQFRGGK